jgi:hypothetical protein
MRRKPSRPVRSVAVLLLAATLVATGCGGGDGGGEANGNSTPTTTTPSPTPTTTTPTPPPTTTTTNTTQKPKKKNIIAWILGLGPGAPSGPPEFTAYRELQNLRCSKVFDRVEELDQPAETLYTGAAQACLAAFNGRGDLWPKAAAAYADVSAKSNELNCMDLAALALLERLVTAHKQNPGGAFDTAGKQNSKAPPCPSITRLEPDHGVEGTTVRVIGSHLDKDIVGVAVFDSTGGFQAAVNVTAVDGGLEFTMPEEPPSDASASVCVVVRAEPDWRADGAMFRYESEHTGPPETFPCPPAEDD